jgi:hypothetical protein
VKARNKKPKPSKAAADLLVTAWKINKLQGTSFLGKSLRAVPFSPAEAVQRRREEIDRELRRAYFTDPDPARRSLVTKAAGAAAAVPDALAVLKYSPDPQERALYYSSYFGGV